MENLKILRTIEVQGHELDIYGSTSEPLFLAVDVARMIDYSTGKTHQMLAIVDDREKILLTTDTIYRRSKDQAVWFLTEYGLYEVLMQSRKPIARRFKNAVKDILHDLRMRGEADFEDWLNYEDPLVSEWEELEDISWEDFLRSKGYTDDMLSDI